MTREEYYYPCSTCHHIECVFTGREDSHMKCKGYTPQEPKTGHWIKVHPLQENDEGDYMCSECKCGGLVWKPTTYCPNCGAKMEKRIEEVEE